MTALLQDLQDTPLSRFIGENALAFPVLEVLHVLAFSLVLGTIFVFDLRLVGLAWRQYPPRALVARLLPVTLVGFGLATVTGVLLLASQPASYFAAWPFVAKLALLLAAGVNAGLYHLFIAARAGEGAELSPIARLSGALSLLLWLGVLVAGRFIGFVVMH